jgi:undecaprenyl-diphosphatase
MLAWWALSGASLPFDLAIRAALHSCASPPLTHVMLAITTLGSEWWMVPLGAVLVSRLVTTGRRRDAGRLVVVVWGAELLSQLMKLLFHRLRPPVFFGLVPAETYSFPSGHAFVGSLFYGLLAVLFLKGRWRWIAVAIAFVLGVSRVYLGYHYPTDVLGGWSLAVIGLALAARRTYVVRQ